jgi:plasmid replication initiation protein
MSTENLSDFKLPKTYDKPNPLVNLQGQRLTALQTNIFALILANITQDDESFKEHIFNINEFKQLTHSNSNSFYKDVRDAIQGIMGKSLTYEYEDKIHITSIIANAEIEPNVGVVKITMDDKIKPFFFDWKLKVGYTKGSLKSLYNIKSIHGKTIYEMLKQWQNTKHTHTIEVKDLRKRLGLENTYKAFKDFELRVLKKAKDEINSTDKDGKKLTDLTIDFEKIKKGRSIHSIKFLFTVTRSDEELLKEAMFESTNKDFIKKTRELFNGFEEFTDFQVYELTIIAQEKVEFSHTDEETYMLKNYMYSLKQNPDNLFTYFKAALQDNYAKA